MARHDLTREEFDHDWVVITKTGNINTIQMWTGTEWTADLSKAQVSRDFGEALGILWNIPKEDFPSEAYGGKAIPLAIFKVWLSDPEPKFFVDGYSV